ncbi:uncharacterized protein LOC129741747 [Uranotaenia lowii]|uniref:uncharacterized protein LOC129741747 n=1 Tax=Uranotaenia lowii TaxID=190385 RepID=UPI002478CE16|nr:uncharacterized protein LOC129741747 [Uranotaenia lowii]
MRLRFVKLPALVFLKPLGIFNPSCFASVKFVLLIIMTVVMLIVPHLIHLTTSKSTSEMLFRVAALLFVVNALYSNDFPVKMVFIFIINLGAKVLAISIVGTNLTKLSDKITTELYNLSWYDAPVDIRRSLLMVLRQSQQRIGLTAGKFGYVDMESFWKIVRTSVSFYLVIKNLHE